MAMAVAFGVAQLGQVGESVMLQVVIISIMAACVGNLAFYAGADPSHMWWNLKPPQGWWRGIQFWVWPCLTFAVTYYLVQAGVVSFLLQRGLHSPTIQMILAGTTMAVMAVYGYYLGHRKFVDSQSQNIPENLQSCPFVMSMLNKSGVSSQTRQLSPASGPQWIPTGTIKDEKTCPVIGVCCGFL